MWTSFYLTQKACLTKKTKAQLCWKKQGVCFDVHFTLAANSSRQTKAFYRNRKLISPPFSSLNDAFTSRNRSTHRANHLFSAMLSILLQAWFKKWDTKTKSWAYYCRLNGLWFVFCPQLFCLFSWLLAANVVKQIRWNATARSRKSHETETSSTDRRWWPLISHLWRFVFGCQNQIHFFPFVILPRLQNLCLSVPASFGPFTSISP